MASRSDVRLNEMSSLFDLGQFPLAVCAGAVLNVVLTLIVTRLIVKSALGVSFGGFVFPDNLILWVVIVLALNLLPVIWLRLLTLKPGASFRPVRQMSFVADQHKFPLWVYLLASANMATWIAISWIIFRKPDNPPVHLVLVVAAVLVTAFPAWIRLVRRG